VRRAILSLSALLVRGPSRDARASDIDPCRRSAENMILSTPTCSNRSRTRQIRLRPGLSKSRLQQL
jgi:hypothetical protein